MNEAPFTPRHRRRRGRGGAVLLVLVAIVVLALVAAGAVLAWHWVGGAESSGGPPGTAHVSPGASAPASPEPTQPGAGEASSPAPGATASPSATASPGAGAAASLPARPHIVTDPQPVPILVYHHVLAKPKGPPLVVMSVDRFRSQMEWLSSHGYQAVTLKRVYDAWTGAGRLPPHPVVITFDDGYADQVRNAAPVLRRYGWPAELDLVSTALYLGDDPPATSLTPEMVRGLLDDGWGLQSHSVSHADLTELWGAKLRRELRGSRARLEELLDEPVDFFCFPGGIYDKRVKLAVRRAGYLAATGTRFGAATPRDLFSLARIYCYRGESAREFGARLEEVLAAEED